MKLHIVQYIPVISTVSTVHLSSVAYLGFQKGGNPFPSPPVPSPPFPSLPFPFLSIPPFPSLSFHSRPFPSLPPPFPYKYARLNPAKGSEEAL